MSAALLDVNVLIAYRWFAGSRGPWATCPLTLNAVLRILGQPRHPNSPGAPAVVAPLVAALIRHPRHCFWPDAVSLLEPSLVDSDRLLEAGQLTDAYLLALAVHHGGQLVTLYQCLNSAAVVGGSEALRLIDL